MKAKLIVGPLLAGGLAAVSASAVAGDSVLINGRRYTCTNTCNVVTYSTGRYSVNDCCGGRVTMTIEPTYPPE